MAKPYDFDGNKYPDLAIGAPRMRVGSVRDAGGVIVLPSSTSGPSLAERVVTASSLGVRGGSEPDEMFGYALASADFDRDGFADLAIGTPYDSVDGEPTAGSVTVVYGSKRGLDATSAVTFTQPGGAVSGLAWGYSLASIDANVDGYPDLVVGAPGDYLGAAGDSKVGILPGGPRGVSDSPFVVLNGRPDTNPDAGVFDGDVAFGTGLAGGDLDLDGDNDWSWCLVAVTMPETRARDR